MKSEERQKLAKERREEKAKYLGKYSGIKAFGDMLYWRRAPPSARGQQAVLCSSCVESGLARSPSCTGRANE